MADFKLGDSENIADVSVIYKVSESLEKTYIFVVSEKLLNEYNLPLQKFVDFLQQKLCFEDPYYEVALELWCSNKSVKSDISLKDTNSEIDNVTEIKTDNQLIHLKNKKN